MHLHDLHGCWVFGVKRMIKILRLVHLIDAFMALLLHPDPPPRSLADALLHAQHRKLRGRAARPRDATRADHGRERRDATPASHRARSLHGQAGGPGRMEDWAGGREGNICRWHGLENPLTSMD